MTIFYFCLASSDFWQTHADYAHSLLCMFVTESAKIYGPGFITYNVHGLTHLAADVKKFGPLDSYSAFPFENFLGSLKKLVRKPQFPLEQVVRRLLEKNEHAVSERKKQSYDIPQKDHVNGPVPSEFIQCVQYSEINFKGFFFSVIDGDNCVKIKNHLYLIRNILVVKNISDPVIVIERFIRTCDFFEYPLKSSDLNIICAYGLSGNLDTAEIGKIQKKYVFFPYKDRFVLIPFSHSSL